MLVIQYDKNDILTEGKVTNFTDFLSLRMYKECFSLKGQILSWCPGLHKTANNLVFHIKHFSN